MPACDADFVNASASLVVTKDANGSTIFQYEAMHIAGKPRQARRSHV